jgi:hypothetical protein
MALRMCASCDMLQAAVNFSHYNDSVSLPGIAPYRQSTSFQFAVFGPRVQ